MPQQPTKPCRWRAGGVASAFAALLRPSTYRDFFHEHEHSTEPVPHGLTAGQVAELLRRSFDLPDSERQRVHEQLTDWVRWSVAGAHTSRDRLRLADELQVLHDVCGEGDWLECATRWLRETVAERRRVQGHLLRFAVAGGLYMVLGLAFFVGSGWSTAPMGDTLAQSPVLTALAAALAIVGSAFFVITAISARTLMPVLVSYGNSRRRERFCAWRLPAMHNDLCVLERALPPLPKRTPAMDVRPPAPAPRGISGIRRHAARRAAGLRAGTDPGDDDDPAPRRPWTRLAASSSILITLVAMLMPTPDSNAAPITPDDAKLSAYLGAPVRAADLREVFAAAGDWVTARDWGETDYDVQGESLRALPDDRREIALRYFENDKLMERVSSRLVGSNIDYKLISIYEQLDPLVGPITELSNTAPEWIGGGPPPPGCEKLARERYEETLDQRRVMLCSYLLTCASRESFKARRRGPSLPTRRRRAPRRRPRARQYRARRRSASRAGPDEGDPEPAGGRLATTPFTGGAR